MPRKQRNIRLYSNTVKVICKLCGPCESEIFMICVWKMACLSIMQNQNLKVSAFNVLLLSNALLRWKLYQFSCKIYCQPIERVAEKWSHKSSQHNLLRFIFFSSSSTIYFNGWYMNESQLFLISDWQIFDPEEIPVFLQSRQLCYRLLYINMSILEGSSKVSI